MPKLSDHPSRDELSAYSLGQLPEERAVAIDSHISECEPCCETMVELSSKDTFAGLLQEAARLTTDQTVDQEGETANSASFDEIPPPLREHPRYEVLGLIGRGGMGDVYKARHRKMERTVALKVINRGLVQKAEAIDRFHREVKAAAHLSHPNIVTSHDADHAGEFHFMVMEFVDGIDLSQTVKKRGALPVAEACDYIRQAAMGLQHAHERGMVHRDIKPHNLMVTADGTVKILDFGLASLAPDAIPAIHASSARSDLTDVGTIMGTPDFISPEQAHDARRVDIRSDIYSLGATLYYLLSGRVPFDDGSVMHKLKSLAQVEPASLSSVRDDVPEKLVAIASKMMAKDPGERYFTPKEVADALESFLRTWQSAEGNALRQGFSNGGNNSDSGRQSETADDSNPSRIPLLAKWLLYTSLFPLGLLILNEFIPLGNFSGELDLFWYCMITSIVLSTLGGIVAGVNQAMTNNRVGPRINGMTMEQTALIIVCLGVSAFIYLNHNSDNTGHLEIVPQSDRMTLGTHPLTIIDNSGDKPLGGTTSTHQNDAIGITTHSFKSANGRYNITLVDKVLTVNGKNYSLENWSDSIRIVDDRVEITRVVSGDSSDTIIADEETSVATGNAVGIENVGNSLKADQNAIQGEWRVILAEDSGRTESQEALRDIRLVITQDQLRMELAGAGNVSTYRLDPSTTPKAIDLTMDGKTKPGIYDLQGDTLRICMSEHTDERPTAFDSQPNSVNDVVLTFKRVKWENVSATKTDDTRDNGPLSDELARSLIPKAASISKEDFQKLQSNPTAQSIKSKSLSLTLLTLNVSNQSAEDANDFKFLVERFPRPSDIAAAMSKSRAKGYFSIIQPDYITECKITHSTDESAQGKVTFNAPQLYIGVVLFEARKREGKWEIVKFQLPVRKVSILLGDDGNWERKVE